MYFQIRDEIFKEDYVDYIEFVVIIECEKDTKSDKTALKMWK